MRKKHAISALLTLLLVPTQICGYFTADDLVRADVVLVGRVVSASDIQTSIVNMDGEATSEVTAVLVTIKVERVMKGAVGDRIELLFWPICPWATGQTIPLYPLRVPATDERMLLMAVKPRGAGGVYIVPIDEERFLAVPSKDTLALQDIYHEEPTGFYELPSKFVLPPAESNLVRSVASILATAAMHEMDGRLGPSLWIWINDLAVCTRVTAPPFYASLGDPKEFEKWVKTDLSPKVREWCLTRTPIDRALAFGALVALGDLDTAPYLLRELLAFDMRGEPVPSMDFYDTLQRLGTSPEYWDSLPRLTYTREPLVRAASLGTMSRMVSSGAKQVILEALKDHLHDLLADGYEEVRKKCVGLLVAITGDTMHDSYRYRTVAGALAPECLEYWRERTR